MDRSFLHEVNHVLSLTVQVGGWPDTYGQRQPEVAIGPGTGIGTVLYPDDADPFRLSTDRAVRVLIGDRIFETNILQNLVSDGFSREQILIQILAHEAYHSNEGQHLQRQRVPFKLFDKLFTPALRESFSDNIRETLILMSEKTSPLLLAMQQFPDEARASALKPFYRLHTKINEGAADVYSLMVFRTLYPDTVVPYAQALEVFRREAFHLSESSPDLDEQVYTYDNASCLASLVNTPVNIWPSSAVGCTAFALRHSVPFLRDEPYFQPMIPLIDRMTSDLDGLIHHLLDVGWQDHLPNPENSTSSVGNASSTTVRRQDRHRR